MDQPSIVTILSNTPGWVFLIFIALTILGFQQIRDRTIGLSRLLMLPLAMSVFSFYSMISSFGWSTIALSFWLAGLVVAVIAFRKRFSAASGKLSDSLFWIKGSWGPFWLMMAIFFIQYFVGYTEAVNSQILQEIKFTAAINLAAGFLGGCFWARTVGIFYHK